MTSAKIKDLEICDGCSQEEFSIVYILLLLKVLLPTMGIQVKDSSLCSENWFYIFEEFKQKGRIYAEIRMKWCPYGWSKKKLTQCLLYDVTECNELFSDHQWGWLTSKSRRNLRTSYICVVNRVSEHGLYSLVIIRIDILTS